MAAQPIGGQAGQFNVTNGELEKGGRLGGKGGQLTAQGQGCPIHLGVDLGLHHALLVSGHAGEERHLEFNGLHPLFLVHRQVGEEDPALVDGQGTDGKPGRGGRFLRHLCLGALGDEIAEVKIPALDANHREGRPAQGDLFQHRAEFNEGEEFEVSKEFVAGEEWTTGEEIGDGQPLDPEGEGEGVDGHLGQGDRSVQGPLQLLLEDGPSQQRQQEKAAKGIAGRHQQRSLGNPLQGRQGLSRQAQTHGHSPAQGSLGGEQFGDAG
jgi:hypothetical protein